MKKLLILLAVTILLFSGCVGQKTDNQKTIKIGDNVSVDYIGSLNGKVFDTSIENVAKENNLSVPNKKYRPIIFIVGKGILLQGIEEGVIGMKVGESKTLTIPPEKAYGQNDPQLIQTIPIIQKLSIIRILPKTFEIPINQFNIIFGSDHKVGDIVKIPDTGINLTVMNINATSNVLVSNIVSVGDKIPQPGLPWNDTVIKIDDKNITIKSEVKKNEQIQFEGVPWNTTVIDVDSENMTLRHNNIPDTKMQNGARVHFNETYISMDSNNELAGDTLIFNVTVVSVD